MSLVATVTNHWDDGKRIHAIGTIAATGNYVTGGDTLSFALYQIKDPRPPLIVLVSGINGYSYSLIIGTTNANGKLKIDTAVNTELAQAGYPSGVSNDTIQFYAIFHKLV
jgi:hypothetical protein